MFLKDESEHDKVDDYNRADRYYDPEYDRVATEPTA